MGGLGLSSAAATFGDSDGIVKGGGGIKYTKDGWKREGEKE